MAILSAAIYAQGSGGDTVGQNGDQVAKREQGARSLVLGSIPSLSPDINSLGIFSQNVAIILTHL